MMGFCSWRWEGVTDMPRWPSSGPVAPLILSPWFMSPYSTDINVANGINVSGTWIAPNQALFFPIAIAHPWIVTKLWWQNGATVTGNVDCGLYTEEQNRILSTGSTAQAGPNAVQSVDVPDTVIPAGTIYFALVMSSTGTVWQNVNNGDAAGYIESAYIQTSALPLPATATFASPIIGMRFVKFGAMRTPRTVL
jgi:hypothetical protein